jgi:hypothetical protein
MKVDPNLISLHDQVKLLQTVAVKLNVKHIDDWYTITREDFEKYDQTLLKIHRGSIYSILKTTYPDIDWQCWRFNRVPQSFWKDKANHRKYFDWLASIKDIKSHHDWYKITRHDIESNGGRSLLHLYDNSPIRAIMVIISIMYILNGYIRRYIQNMIGYLGYLKEFLVDIGMIQRIIENISIG